MIYITSLGKIYNKQFPRIRHIQQILEAHYGTETGDGNIQLKWKTHHHLP